MGYLSNIKKQYWISFFHSLVPAYVIERLFWQERGMNVQMVVYAEIIYALTVTLGEVPSGILADRFGRKRLLIINGLLSVFELVIILFAHNFWYFAIAVFLAGVGKAFSSGSENALLYDSLLAEGKQESFERILGRISAVDFTGSVIAALSGGILANFFNFELNYIISITSMFIGSIITMSLKEPPMSTTPENGISGVIQYIKQASSVFKLNPLVLLYSLSGALLGACIIYLDEFWQVILGNIGIPVLFFGVVSASGLALRIPGNLIAYKLKGKHDYSYILICVISVSIVGYTAIFFLKNVYCLIPMMFLFFATSLVDPLVTAYLHHHSDSHVRATVESLSSMGLRILSIGVGLLFGYISTAISIFAGFLILGAICFIYLIVFIARMTHRANDN